MGGIFDFLFCVFFRLLSRDFFLGVMKVVLRKVGGTGFGEEK